MIVITEDMTIRKEVVVVSSEGLQERVLGK
jgi:hypothetical protein